MITKKTVQLLPFEDFFLSKACLLGCYLKVPAWYLHLGSLQTLPSQGIWQWMHPPLQHFLLLTAPPCNSSLQVIFNSLLSPIPNSAPPAANSTNTFWVPSPSSPSPWLMFCWDIVSYLNYYNRNKLLTIPFKFNLKIFCILFNPSLTYPSICHQVIFLNTVWSNSYTQCSKTFQDNQY